jgi:ABC-2 type transport system ATP-binding protein
MITARELTKSFGAVWALSGVSFDVSAGEIFGFVGPNGAGKTTSMRILAGLMAPSSGTASIAGVDVRECPEEARERIGYMPDFFGVYDQLTAGEYLAFYASCYRIPRYRIDRVVSDLLELIGLPEKRNLPVDSLSRGMKQRLCLARALVHDPPVLLLDEPASGLDPRARIEMRELLKELQDMGKTIVLSSHILPELAEMCTTFGIIDQGRMVATGPLESLTSRRDHRRVQVKLVNDLDESLALIAAVPAVIACQRRGDVVELEYEGGDVECARLLRQLVNAGVQLLSFTPVETSLEEVFMRTLSEPSAV